MSEEEGVVICLLTSEATVVSLGSTLDTPCDRCKRPLVLSLASQDWLARGIATRAVCFDCAAVLAQGRSV